MSKRIGLICTLVIAAVGLVVFQPELKIGFEGGWWYLEWVAKLPIRDYLWQFFDPGHVTQGYRPMQGLMVLAEYSIFQFNTDGYHFAQIVMHIITSWLLFAIVWRISRNLPLALLSAIIYVCLPAYHLALFRAPAVVDPFAAIFYLGTIWIWINYLESRRTVFYLLTLFIFALSLLSKEISVFLPLVLFLIDFLFVKKKRSMSLVIWQYMPFVVVMIPYLLLELNVQSHGEFSRDFGYKLGPQFLSNLVPYLAVMTTPWYLDNFNVPIDIWMYVWMTALLITLVFLAWNRRNVAIPFLVFFAVVNISPLLGFPPEWFQARYLYIPFMSTAILFAMFCLAVWHWLNKWRTYSQVALSLVVLMVLFNGQLISAKAAEWAEYTRVVRVPFRDISRQHPAFPDDTYLYFTYSPFTSVPDFEGLFFVRYGSSVTVDGVDTGHPAELREHNAAFVYYFDSTGRPIEVPVEKNAQPQVSYPLPVKYDIPVVLENVQVPGTALERGKALVTLLNWRATAKVNKNYTVFAHLVDQNQNLIASFDTVPRRGTSPTSTWEIGQLITDALLLPIASDAPLGEGYWLQLGLYDPANMQRPSVIDADGHLVSDSVNIGPFSIVP